jgi:NADH dehydrogenase FAD-containing subunit
VNPPRVVIVGGGFGGLNAARALAGADLGVTLLDRHNYHLFQPLLYQVATASLSPGDVASPIRWILRHQKNVEVLLANVRAIDPAARQVLIDAGDPIAYDYLVLAAGVPADPPVSAAEPTCRVCGKRDKAHGNETHAYDPDGTVRDMVRDFEDGNR